MAYVDSLFHRVERRGVDVTIENSTAGDLKIYVVPVMVSFTSERGDSLVAEGARIALADLATGQKRNESIEDGAVLIFVDGQGEIYRERVTNRPEMSIKVRVRPTADWMRSMENGRLRLADES